MTRVQSPEIGNVLRTALQLDAAGGMPMTASTDIVPVAIVADLSDQLRRKFTAVSGVGFQAAVAAEFSMGVLHFASDRGVKRLLIDSITIASTGAGTFWWGFAAITAPPFVLTATYDPKRKQSSLMGGGLAGIVYNSTALNPATTEVTNKLGVVYLAANSTTRIILTEPIVVDTGLMDFVVMANTANITLYTTFEWREEVA